MTIITTLVISSILLVYRLFRLFHPRHPRFDVSAVSDYWLQQQRDTSGDTHR